MNLPGIASILAIAASLALAQVVCAAPAQSPDQMVQRTSTQLLKQIRKDKKSLQNNPEAMYRLAKAVVLPHFDVDYMSQLILGRYWNDATPQQRERFGTAFTRMLVRAYGNALLAYESEPIQWDPATLSGNDATVRSTVIRSGAPAIPISYTLHVQNDAWRVYDISIDEISLVTNYRGSFAAEIKKSGLDGLITHMEQQTPMRGA